MKPHTVRFTPSYWLWVAGWITVGVLLGLLPSVLGGCSHDFIDLSDVGCDCACPDTEQAESETPAPVTDAAEVPDETTAADVYTEDANPEEAAAEDTEPDVPELDATDDVEPDVEPDVPDDDGIEDAEAEDVYTCEPAACTETCAEYGYPVGTCDGFFCVCGDGDDGGPPPDVGPPEEDCFRLGDEDSDGLRDCADPDCSVLIWCLCEPACGRPECCRGGTCTPPKTCP